MSFVRQEYVSLVLSAYKDDSRPSPEVFLTGVDLLVKVVNWCKGHKGRQGNTSLNPEMVDDIFFWNMTIPLQLLCSAHAVCHLNNPQLTPSLPGKYAESEQRNLLLHFGRSMKIRAMRRNAA